MARVWFLSSGSGLTLRTVCDSSDGSELPREPFCCVFLWSECATTLYFCARRWCFLVCSVDPPCLGALSLSLSLSRSGWCVGFVSLCYSSGGSEPSSTLEARSASRRRGRNERQAPNCSRYFHFRVARHMELVIGRAAERCALPPHLSVVT